MSTPWCDRPPLRGDPQVLAMSRFLTFMTGTDTVSGAADVINRAKTTGCRRTGNAAHIAAPVAARIAIAVRQPRSRRFLIRLVGVTVVYKSTTSMLGSNGKATDIIMAQNGQQKFLPKR